MNWYKLAQQTIPISIVSYYQTYEQLRVSFNGSKPYTYYNVNPLDFDKIRNLLRHKNYTEVQKILSTLSQKREYTSEEKKEMLDELYERGILK